MCHVRGSVHVIARSRVQGWPVSVGERASQCVAIIINFTTPCTRHRETGSRPPLTPHHTRARAVAGVRPECDPLMADTQRAAFSAPEPIMLATHHIHHLHCTAHVSPQFLPCSLLALFTTPCEQLVGLRQYHTRVVQLNYDARCAVTIACHVAGTDECRVRRVIHMDVYTLCYICGMYMHMPT